MRTERADTPTGLRRKGKPTASGRDRWSWPRPSITQLLGENRNVNKIGHEPSGCPALIQLKFSHVVFRDPAIPTMQDTRL